MDFGVVLRIVISDSFLHLREHSLDTKATFPPGGVYSVTLWGQKLLEDELVARTIFGHFEKLFLGWIFSSDPWPLHKPPWHFQIRGAQKGKYENFGQIEISRKMGFEAGSVPQNGVQNCKFLC